MLNNKMNIFCTLSDKNYLLNGLALYESLNTHTTQPFLLYYLCMDDQTYKIINKLPHSYAIHIDNFINTPDFKMLVKNHPYRPINTSDGQSPFHWATTPMFTHYILKTFKEEHCLYIDSDIIFYEDPQQIFNSVANYDIGLITHKHLPLEKYKHSVGYYNVGIIFFRNTAINCCKWWKNVTIDTSNQYYNPYGSCGDQKYLELFAELFPNLSIKVIDLDIGHGAPWHLGPTTLKDMIFTWGSKFVTDNEYETQPLVFYHFSHFTPNFENGTWKHDRKGEWGNIIDTDDKRELYQNYFNKLKYVKDKYL